MSVLEGKRVTEMKTNRERRRFYKIKVKDVDKHLYSSVL